MTRPWDLLFEEDDPPFEESTPPPKRGPGRPKGRKTTPRETITTEKQLRELYNRFEPFLTDGQKDYIQGIIDGKADVDCRYELKLLVRQMALLYQEAAMIHFAERRISRELAEFGNTLRMTIKDLADLERLEEDRATREQKTNDLVRITERGSSLEALEAFLGEGAQG